MILKKIEIEYQYWGEDRGRYKGKITFEEGADTFTFGMTPDVCVRYLNPISQEVIKSAKELGDKLAQSFIRQLENHKP